MRNLTLIKCTPGYPMSSGHPSVLGSAGMAAHLPVIVERKRVNRALTAAVRVQTIDFPSIASAPPHERRT